MAQILRKIADSLVCVNGNAVWFKQGSTYYQYGMVWDAGLGIYTWNLIGSQTSIPKNTRNLSGRVLGGSFYILDPADVFHQYVMTTTGTPSGYAWSDNTQGATAPDTTYTLTEVRFDDGLHIVDVNGELIHKMGVDSSGFWQEENQGTSLPL